MKQVTSSGAFYKLAPDVLARRLGDGAVFVHLPTNSIFELNETAAAAWDLLQEGLDPQAAGRRLAEQFTITPDAAAREVETLVDALRTRGLIA